MTINNKHEFGYIQGVSFPGLSLDHIANLGASFIVPCAASSVQALLLFSGCREAVAAVLQHIYTHLTSGNQCHFLSVETILQASGPVSHLSHKVRGVICFCSLNLLSLAHNTIGR